MKNKNVLISGGIANIFEWYDYALFGHLASVISTKFFPHLDKSSALIETFFLFAVGYLMRPIGGVVFGSIGDKIGRKYALSASIICMSFPTMIMGIIPTYESIGIWSTIIMGIARMVQGFSMGGALTGSVSFIIEHTEKSKRGLMGSIPMFGVCVGILFGSIVCNSIKAILSEEDFLDYGWRIPFIFGIFIMYVGFYIKKYTEETPVFEDIKKNHEIEKSPILEVLKNHKMQILISVLINSTGSVIFYLQAIYITSYLVEQKQFDQIYASYIINSCYVVMAVVTLLSGYLSDVIGRKKIFILLLLTILLTNFYVLDSIQENNNILTIFLGLNFFGILAAFYIGPEPAMQAEFYDSKIRNTALAISYNLATAIFGGTTPYILSLLMMKYNDIRSFSYYISFCCVLSLIGVTLYRKAK